MSAHFLHVSHPGTVYCYVENVIPSLVAKSCKYQEMWHFPARWVVAPCSSKPKSLAWLWPYWEGEKGVYRDRSIGSATM